MIRTNGTACCLNLFEAHSSWKTSWFFFLCSLWKYWTGISGHFAARKKKKSKSGINHNVFESTAMPNLNSVQLFCVFYWFSWGFQKFFEFGILFKKHTRPPTHTWNFGPRYRNACVWAGAWCQYECVWLHTHTQIFPLLNHGPSREGVFLHVKYDPSRDGRGMH